MEGFTTSNYLIIKVVVLDSSSVVTGNLVSVLHLDSFRFIGRSCTLSPDRVLSVLLVVIMEAK